MISGLHKVLKENNKKQSKQYVPKCYDCGEPGHFSCDCPRRMRYSGSHDRHERWSSPRADYTNWGDHSSHDFSLKLEKITSTSQVKYLP